MHRGVAPEMAAIAPPEGWGRSGCVVGLALCKSGVTLERAAPVFPVVLPGKIPLQVAAYTSSQTFWYHRSKTKKTKLFRIRVWPVRANVPKTLEENTILHSENKSLSQEPDQCDWPLSNELYSWWNCYMHEMFFIIKVSLLRSRKSSIATLDLLQSCCLNLKVPSWERSCWLWRELLWCCKETQSSFLRKSAKGAEGRVIWKAVLSGDSCS